MGEIRPRAYPVITMKDLVSPHALQDRAILIIVSSAVMHPFHLLQHCSSQQEENWPPALRLSACNVELKQKTDLVRFCCCLAHPVTQLLPLICYFDQPAYDLIPPAAAPTPSFLTWFYLLLSPFLPNLRVKLIRITLKWLIEVPCATVHTRYSITWLMYPLFDQIPAQIAVLYAHEQ